MGIESQIAELLVAEMLGTIERLDSHAEAGRYVQSRFGVTDRPVFLQAVSGACPSGPAPVPVRFDHAII